MNFNSPDRLFFSLKEDIMIAILASLRLLLVIISIPLLSLPDPVPVQVHATPAIDLDIAVSSAPLTVGLPFPSGSHGVFSYDVNWGDGTNQQGASWDSGTQTTPPQHTYN